MPGEDHQTGEHHDKVPIKGSHYGMRYTGTKDPNKGKIYRCPICYKEFYWSEARRHYHSKDDV